MTETPGASAVFERGWVVYTDDAKRQELDVPAALLRRHGAVRAEGPAMFALTIERHGGVVVSKRDKIAAIAKVESHTS